MHHCNSISDKFKININFSGKAETEYNTCEICFTVKSSRDNRTKLCCFCNHSGTWHILISVFNYPIMFSLLCVCVQTTQTKAVPYVQYGNLYCNNAIFSYADTLLLITSRHASVIKCQHEFYILFMI